MSYIKVRELFSLRFTTANGKKNDLMDKLNKVMERYQSKHSESEVKRIEIIFSDNEKKVNIEIFLAGERPQEEPQKESNNDIEKLN